MRETVQMGSASVPAEAATPVAAAGEPMPGTPDSFRLLTARLKGRIAPSPPPPPPAARAVPPEPPPPPRPTLRRAPPEPPPAPVPPAPPPPVHAPPAPAAEAVVIPMPRRGPDPGPVPEPPPPPMPDTAPEPPPPVVPAAAEPAPQPPHVRDSVADSEPPAPPPFVPAPPHLTGESADQAGEAALGLLDLLASTSGLLPQERALAGDTLLLLLPRLHARHLLRLADRVAMMEAPPPLLLARLIRDDRPEVMGPVLERCLQISDDDLIAAAPVHDVERLRFIARRRLISPVLAAHLIASGDPGVILGLLRNVGAQLPPQGFPRLCALAAEHGMLRAPLATRPELPAAAAFELYWCLPPELRRLMLSRFLTDSGTLSRILRVAHAEEGRPAGAALREEGAVMAEELQAAVQSAAAGRLDEAAARFAELAFIMPDTARRILADPDGEPLAVLSKALGMTRSRFEETLERLSRGHDTLPSGVSLADLQAVFDGLSYTKARVLLAYWDWHTRQTGPYAPAA